MMSSADFRPRPLLSWPVSASPSVISYYEGGKLTKGGQAFLEREQPDICVFGHTHQSKTDCHGSTLLFNSGSAGPKRFTLPRGLGILTIEGGRIEPTLIMLGDRME